MPGRVVGRRLAPGRDGRDVIYMERSFCPAWERWQYSQQCWHLNKLYTILGPGWQTIVTIEG
jgi:hypothetical protein